jgi:hypothetical protein
MLVWEYVLPGEVRGGALEDLHLDLEPALISARLGEFFLLLARQLFCVAARRAENRYRPGVRRRPGPRR